MFCVLLTLTFFSSNTLAATPCPNLTSLVLLDTTITLAESLPAGANPAPSIINGGIPDSRSAGLSRTFTRPRIPISKWKCGCRRLVGMESSWEPEPGKFYGQIQYDQLMFGIGRGYATVASDMGHKSGQDDASWAFGHPEKVDGLHVSRRPRNDGQGQSHRAGFLWPVSAAFVLVGMFDGRKSGIKEAQLYPQDYDGVTVAAPVNNWTQQEAAHLYNALSTFKNGQARRNTYRPKSGQ